MQPRSGGGSASWREMPPLLMQRPLWFRIPFHKQIPVWVFLFLFVGTLISVLAGQKPSRQYKEGHIFTLFSTTLLGFTGLTALLVYRKRSAGRESFRQRIRAPEFLWILIGGGFIYLALDEVACIHEKMGEMIRIGLRLEETPLTDRIDGVLVVIYGMIGLWALWVYRQEMRFFKTIRAGLTIGFILLAVSLSFDLLTDDSTLFRMWLPEAWWRVVFEWTGAFEDACKIMAVAFFLSAFLEARVSARKDQEPGTSPAGTD